jgi:hypothetical protein
MGVLGFIKRKTMKLFKDWLKENDTVTTDSALKTGEVDILLFTKKKKNEQGVNDAITDTTDSNL